jgi:hypothetical protein
MALPLLLGAAKGLIGSGKKKPKSGKEVAGKIVQRKEKQDAKKPSTQKKLAPAKVSGTKFFKGGSSTPKIKTLKPNTGNSQLDNVLESIQSSISKLTRTIKNFIKFKRKDNQTKTQRKNKMLARLREVGFGMIGGVLSLGKKLLSKIPFFDRIKNFFVNILLGGIILMILDNIKPIIETIKNVVAEVKKLFKLINKYFFQPLLEAGKFLINTVLPIINDIINSAPAQFIKTQIESLIKTIGDQFPKLEKVVNDLKNIQIPGMGLLKDLIGTDNSPDGSIPGSAGQTTFEVIAGGEGGYNSVNQGNAGDTPGGSQELFGKDLTEMTVGEIMDAQASGKVFAVGKYQIIDTTMAEWVNHPKGGVSRSDKFDETTQEKFKTYVINIKRPEIGRYLRGESDDVVAAAQGIAREFASVGLSRPEAGRGVDQSRYAGTGNNAASISSREIQQALEFDRGQYQQQLPPVLRYQAQAGKSRVQTDIEEFRQFRTQFGYTSERKPTLHPENLQIREMGTYGSGNYDISPLADDTNYEINEHRGAGHHENRAFDIPVPSKAVGDKVNQFWKSKGYTTIWQSSGHYNHVHVEVPKNKAAEFFNIAPQQPRVTAPSERQTAEEISRQTDYERMRTIFMPIAVPTEGGGNTSSGGGPPAIIGGGSSRDTYLQIMMENKLFKQ